MRGEEERQKGICDNKFKTPRESENDPQNAKVVAELLVA